MKRSINKSGRFALVVAAVCFLAPATAAAGQQLMRIPIKSPRVFEQLRRPGIEILAVNKDRIIDAIVDDRQVDYVFSLGYPVSAMPIDDISLAPAALDANLGLYHTYAEMESVITEWETNYPAVCDVFTIGSSHEDNRRPRLPAPSVIPLDMTRSFPIRFPSLRTPGS